MRNGLAAGVALLALLSLPASARIEASPSRALDEARSALASLRERSEASAVSVSAARIGGSAWSGGSMIASAEIATRDVPPPPGESGAGGGSGGDSGSGTSGGGPDVVLEPYDGSWASVFAAIGLSLVQVAGSPAHAAQAFGTHSGRFLAKAARMELDPNDGKRVQNFFLKGSIDILKKLY